MPVRRHPPHEPLLTLHIRGLAMVPVVADAVGAVAEALGFDRSDADRAQAAASVLCASVCEQAFDDPEAAEFDVFVESGPASLRFTVEDWGLPFTSIGAGSDGSAWSDADAVRVRRQDVGHRIEVDVRARADVAGIVDRTAGVDAASLEGEIEVRDLEPGDEQSLARMIWRVYGYTYVADYLYHPERLRRLREEGWLHAVVALIDGEVVGLNALVLAHPDDKVADWTLAATDPRVRGRGVMAQVGAGAARHATDLELVAYFAEAVTEHTITQRGAVERGAVETAVLLGFIPEGMRYKGFPEAPTGSRQSAVLSFKTFRPPEARTVHLPDRYADELRRKYREGGLERHEQPGTPPTGETRVHVELEVARDLATIELERAGDDAVEQVARHLRQALAQGAELVYCELSLGDPGTPAVVEGLRGHGFFWGGMIPELRGDVLRLQYLDFEPDLEVMQLYSDEARRLLDFQLADRP